MSPLFARLKQRKLVQWTLAYLTGAWLVWQVMDVLGERWGLTAGMGRAIDLLLIVGFFVALILAWYHGEQGRQKISGPELLMLGGLLTLTAVSLTLVGTSTDQVIEGLDDLPIRAAGMGGEASPRSRCSPSRT